MCIFFHHKNEEEKCLIWSSTLKFTSSIWNNLYLICSFSTDILNEFGNGLNSGLNDALNDVLGNGLNDALNDVLNNGLNDVWNNGWNGFSRSGGVPIAAEQLLNVLSGFLEKISEKISLVSPQNFTMLGWKVLYEVYF